MKKFFLASFFLVVALFTSTNTASASEATDHQVRISEIQFLLTQTSDPAEIAALSAELEVLVTEETKNNTTNSTYYREPQGYAYKSLIEDKVLDFGERTQVAQVNIYLGGSEDAVLNKLTFTVDPMGHKPWEYLKNVYLSRKGKIISTIDASKERNWDIALKAGAAGQEYVRYYFLTFEDIDEPISSTEWSNIVLSATARSFTDVSQSVFTSPAVFKFFFTQKKGATFTGKDTGNTWVLQVSDDDYKRQDADLSVAHGWNEKNKSWERDDIEVTESVSTSTDVSTNKEQMLSQIQSLLQRIAALQEQLRMLNTSRASVTTGLSVGSEVTVKERLNVRQNASDTSVLLGTQPMGMTGTIVDGPVTSGGYSWLKVNYSSGVDGWSVANWLY
jgi:hypothetical protein